MTAALSRVARVKPLRNAGLSRGSGRQPKPKQTISACRNDAFAPQLVRSRNVPAVSRKEVRRLMVFLKRVRFWFRLKFEFEAGFNVKPE
jgi:hypothetical protein